MNGNYFRVIFLFFLLEMSCWTLTAQSKDPLQISLLTCDQGDALYSTFGHTALRVRDFRNNRDLVYNYGTFDTETPGFYFKFMRGKLPYVLSRSPYEYFLRDYNYEKRGVTENILQLNSQEEMKLFQLLENNLLPANRFYPYDFFFDNCATRIRDIVPDAINGEIIWNENTRHYTYRDLLHEHLTGMPWSEFGIDLVIGAKADKAVSFADEMFLPVYLQENFQEAWVEKRDTSYALVEEPYKVLIFDEIKEKRKEKPMFTPHIAFLIILLFEALILFFWRNHYWVRIWHKTLLFTVGIGSLIILFLWFLTAHQACRPNWNIIWMNPLYLIITFMKEGWVRIITKLLIITGIVLAYTNTYFPFLPQKFNLYNLGLYTIILLVMWIESRVSVKTNPKATV